MTNRFLASDVRTVSTASETTLQTLINTINEGITVGGDETTPVYTVADSSYTIGTANQPTHKGHLMLIEDSNGDYDS